MRALHVPHLGSIPYTSYGPQRPPGAIPGCRGRSNPCLSLCGPKRKRAKESRVWLTVASAHLAGNLAPELRRLMSAVASEPVTKAIISCRNQIQ